MRYTWVVFRIWAGRRGVGVLMNFRWLVVVAATLGWSPLVAGSASADTGTPSEPTPEVMPQPAPQVSLQPADTTDWFTAWQTMAAQAKAQQPSWSSPIVTTTSLLENRFRFETAWQHAGNGTSTTDIDGGKGLDVIITPTEEIQIGMPPYYERDATKEKQRLSGFADWPAFRFKQRLASAPEGQGNYIVSAWLQVQFPIGISKLTNHSVVFLPTLGFGKGWGPFDIQGTVGGVLPTAHQGTIGNQIVTNVAFQYHLLQVLWPQIEVNWTNYPDGPRAGKN